MTRQLLIELDHGDRGERRRRVRRLPRGARLSGAAAPWVWRRLQATHASMD